MQIISARKINTADYGAITEHPNLYAIHVQVSSNDLEIIGTNLLNVINDSSWMMQLDDIDRCAYEARAVRTMQKITDIILTALEDNNLTNNFGEYMVSHTAQEVLRDTYNHTRIPLPELWKEKKTGNPGYDFHTLSNTNIIVFGEAKYSSQSTPSYKAIKQINDFITIGKDLMELSDLKTLVSEESARNAINGVRGYTAAFSARNFRDIETVIKKSIEHTIGTSIINASEIYIVAVEII